jgi:CBS domain-containing protein
MPLTAKDIMHTKLVTVRPDQPLSELSEIFFRHCITGAPVVDPDGDGSPGTVLGVISRSDLVRFPLYRGAMAGMLSDYFRALSAAEGDQNDAPPPPESLQEILSNHTVREAMAASPVTVSPDTPVRDIARAMASEHLHRALVVDGNKLVGLISSLDIVQLVADGADL